VPVLDHTRPANFGGVELNRRENTEFVGQEVDYSPGATKELPCLTLDALGLNRVDLIKIDIEGMEMEALAGAEDILRRHRPIVIVEFFKSDKVALQSLLEAFDFKVFELRVDLVALHCTDRSLDHVKI